jgi:hypothetical protein
MGGAPSALAAGLGAAPAGDAAGTMATRFLRQIADFARSPQGRKVATEAKRLASDPGTRRRIDEARRRLMKRGGGGTPR